MTKFAQNFYKFEDFDLEYTQFIIANYRITLKNYKKYYLSWDNGRF